MNARRLCLIVALGSAATSHALTLDAALARTLENNPAIREAQARLEQAAGRRLVLRATALPDVRVLIPGGVQGGKRAGEKELQPFAFARGLFTQPLFDAAIPPSYRRGDIEVLLAQQRLNVAVIEQLHTARVAYYTAAYHDSLLILGEAQRLRLESNARAQSDRYEAGRTDRQAVTVARLLEQEVQPRVEESRRAAERRATHARTHDGRRPRTPRPDCLPSTTPSRSPRCTSMPRPKAPARSSGAPI